MQYSVRWPFSYLVLHVFFMDFEQDGQAFFQTLVCVCVCVYDAIFISICLKEKGVFVPCYMGLVVVYIHVYIVHVFE